MKNIKIVLFIIFLIMVVYSFPFPVFGDSQLDLSIGIGVPEFIKVGIRYNIGQLQFGLNYGFLPIENETCTSINGDIYFHFAGSSKYTVRKPWYSRFGLSFVKHKQEQKTSSYVYSNFRVGREFWVSKRVGIGLDVGISLELYKEIKEEQENTGWFDFDWECPILPCISVNIFYHFDFFTNNKG